jgi:hypothetical protein
MLLLRIVIDSETPAGADHWILADVQGGRGDEIRGLAQGRFRARPCTWSMIVVYCRSLCRMSC